ncbi:hypothetical protein HN709_00830 [Candidatus Peregrinibacteria bacterium]|mgnify:CR=1 FL=1|jgi:hypothetical protein|nr:hypothetical protein [Candidatus Peregrinibacteria bacterium]
MSLESFIGLDQGEPMSEAAFEKFKEKMARAQAQIAQIKKEEGKQKKKEQDLLKILSHFVRTSHKSDLVLLITRVLEQDIPANFVLAIVVLGNEDIQKAAGKEFLLSAPDLDPAAEEKALIFFSEEDETIPLRVKIEVDNWIKGMMIQAEDRPHKLLKNAYFKDMVELPKENDYDEAEYKEETKLKDIVYILMAYILKDFLRQNNQPEESEKLEEFCEFILTGILNKTQENLDNRQELKGDIN